MLTLESLASKAVVYAFHAQIDGHTRLVNISYERDGWHIKISAGPMNSWALGKDLAWHESWGDPFETRQAAIDGLNKALLSPVWKDWKGEPFKWENQKTDESV